MSENAFGDLKQGVEKKKAGKNRLGPPPTGGNAFLGTNPGAVPPASATSEPPKAQSVKAKPVKAEPVKAPEPVQKAVPAQKPTPAPVVAKPAPVVAPEPVIEASAPVVSSITTDLRFRRRSKRTVQLSMRTTEETRTKIRELMDEFDVNQVEILEKGIEMLYSSVKAQGK